MRSIDLPPGSVRPRYGSDSICEVPAAIGNLLGVSLPGASVREGFLGDSDLSGIENVVLVVSDGFGMHEWRRQDGAGLMSDIKERGSVKAITTVFPSTTSAALTSIATGLTPQEHALPEWFVYMKEVNSVILTLPFSFMGDWGRETLKGRMSPRALFRGTPLFKKFRACGVETRTFTSRGLAGTTYTRLIHGGSDIIPYSGSSDMVASLRRTIESARGRSFSYVYWSHVDTIEHAYGPGTEESELEASSLSFVLHTGFVKKLAREVAKKTLLVFTADHGQVSREGDTLYLSRFRSLTKRFRKVGGKRVTPAGSPRDVFLYMDKGEVDYALDFLGRKLAGEATVLRTQDAIGSGLFGLNSPSRKFKDRVGDILVLPHGRRTIWYRGERGYRLDMRGYHGGLTADEMLVPLATGRLSDLQDASP